MVPKVSPSSTAARRAPAAKAVRMLGHYQLLRLLGKSDQTMLWLGSDCRCDVDVMVILPRVRPVDAQALSAWLARAHRQARMVHPHLAKVVDVDEQAHWPYVVYERGHDVTWAERLTSRGLPAPELARWGVQALQGLAFAHHTGAAHRDLQLYCLLVDDAGAVKVLGVDIAELPREGAPAAAAGFTSGDESQQAHRAIAIDLLAFGLLMHQALTGTSALDEPDVSRAVRRLAPYGHEISRLPWEVPRPIPDALRAIVNRATDSHERRRYPNARAFERAIAGFLRVSVEARGPVALLLDRFASAGVLPAMPGEVGRAARLAQWEHARTDELAGLVLQDWALAFEVLRRANGVPTQSGQVSDSGSGAVLAMHRAIAIIGLDGIQHAARSLRPWPGAMDQAAAARLDMLIRRIQRAADVAHALQPAGYDVEVVRLMVALQNLGWLVVQYHFPDDAMQIRRLIASGETGARPPSIEVHGMPVEAAASAVLGYEIDAMSAALLRYWGFDERVQHLARPLPANGTVPVPVSDDEILRTLASCANHTLDAVSQPAARVAHALAHVAQRYGTALNLGLHDLQKALRAPSAHVG